MAGRDTGQSSGTAAATDATYLTPPTRSSCTSNSSGSALWLSTWRCVANVGICGRGCRRQRGDMQVLLWDGARPAAPAVDGATAASTPRGPPPRPPVAGSPAAPGNPARAAPAPESCSPAAAQPAHPPAQEARWHCPAGVAAGGDGGGQGLGTVVERGSAPGACPHIDAEGAQGRQMQGGPASTAYSRTAPWIPPMHACSQPPGSVAVSPTITHPPA